MGTAYFTSHTSTFKAIPGPSGRKVRLARIFQMTALRLSVTRPLITDHTAAPFSLRVAFLRLVEDAPPCTSPAHKAYNAFNLL
jgi:hypothetical protein